VRFSLGLPTDRVDLPDEFVTGAAVGEMARTAEALGFEAVFVTDHPIPSDAWMETGGHHALDPFVALSFAAAATTRLRLHTNLVVVPYRNPFLLAKSVASLDALSGGRVSLGVGAGYLEAEFRALGADFEHRNERMDESLRVMKRAWTGNSVDVAGPGYEARGHHALPRPVQRPHPPLWIGGNAERAIRRAVELGDGWMPFLNPASKASRRRSPPMMSTEHLQERLAYLREHAASVGRPVPRDLVYMPRTAPPGSGNFDPAAARDHVAELAALGVTVLSVGIPGETRSEWTKNAEIYARAVVEPTAG
jgi:probable F420-dependent oxidoreductase